MWTPKFFKIFSVFLLYLILTAVSVHTNFICLWLYYFLFFLSLSPAGCPDSLIKEVHHFRVLGDEQVGLDSEIRRSHLHTCTHTHLKQPTLSWSRLMRNPSSSWLSDRHMREALNWPICCSPMPFTKPSARNQALLCTFKPAIIAVRKVILWTRFLRMFCLWVFTPIGAVMRHLCKAPLGMFLLLCFWTCCYGKWPLLTSVCILFVSLSPVLMGQSACGPDVKTKFTLHAHWVIFVLIYLPFESNCAFSGEKMMFVMMFLMLWGLHSKQNFRIPS